MQNTSGVNELTRLSNSGGGGTGTGLVRFRSAPATWIDALLHDDDDDNDNDDDLKLGGHHHQSNLTQLLTAGTSTADPTPSGRASYIQPEPDPNFFESSGAPANTSGSGFHRMNSSPAEFMSGNVDGYFSSFGVSSTFDYPGSSTGVSGSGKRLREADAQRRGEQSGQLSTSSSLLDMEMERLFEDSVPCKVRAKRGFATHPRSIAERVRRTKISDRIRKLQELVPNMDKQTNTSDMLDEAVEYVKNLQKQIQELTEQQKNCKCIMKS